MMQPDHAQIKVNSCKLMCRLFTPACSWVLIVIPMAPVVLYAVCALYQRYAPVRSAEPRGSGNLSIVSESELVGVGKAHEDTTNSATLNVLQRL